MPATNPFAFNRTRIASLFSKVRVDESGCWLWTKALNGKGYAIFNSANAHRVTYAWFVGPIPKGLEIDHLCRVRHCVNPAHLEAVTGIENRRRANRFNTTGKCKKGHVLADGNMGFQRTNGRTERMCLACRCLTRRRWFEKHGKFTYLINVRDSRGNLIRREQEAA